MLDKRNGHDGTLRTMMENMADENLQAKVVCDSETCVQYNKGFTESCKGCPNILTNHNAIIDGVGKDAEIVTNAAGGKQSKSPSALHLVDPHYLIGTVRQFCATSYVTRAIEKVTEYMVGGGEERLHMAISILSDCSKSGILKGLLEIGKILQYGATEGNGGKGYPVNNWRLIPREDHINHALIHLIALLAGDTQDEHKGHAMCRLHMALATTETKGFYYNKPADTLEETENL